MMVTRLRVAALVCVFIGGLKVDGCQVNKIVSEVGIRFGNETAENVIRLVDSFQHLGSTAKSDKNVETKIRSWFEPREVLVYIGNQTASAEATACVGLPDDPALNLACYYVGEPVNCSAPAQVGTVAYMGCSSGYKATHYHGYNSITCNGTFVWSNRPLHCVADCGRQNAVGGREFISKGEEVQVGEFSWHIGIYQVNESQLYSQICGGSLITPAYVLTAAHCFWDMSANTVRPKELFSIAAGKFNIDWYSNDRGLQRRNLSAIHLAPRFAGNRHFLTYDIALVQLDKDITLTPLINIICMDFEHSLEPLHLIPGKNGTIAGWGITELNEASDVLKSVRLPYITVEECEHIVDFTIRKYLAHDKFCAGYLNRATSICPGDSGGGYVFPQQTADGTRFYIHGIASVGHTPKRNSGLKCRTEQVAAFTRVSLYMSWIKKIVLGS